MATYTRVSNINEKVNDLSLTMTQWRVLFAVNTDTDLETIQSYLDATSEAEITAAINSLISMGLLEGEAANAPTESAPTPKSEPAPTPTPVKEAVIEEPVAEPEEEDITFEEDETVEEDIQFDGDDSNELADIVAEIEEDVTFDEEMPVDTQPEKAAEPVVESVPEPPPAAPAETSDKKMLVVADDSIVIRKMVELALENEAFNVVGYSSGQAVLDNFSKDNPDLVILDQNLPDAKGVEIITKIKAKKQIPCLMFASKNAGIDEDKLKSEGVDDFVAKPFRDEDLIAKVKSLA